MYCLLLDRVNEAKQRTTESHGRLESGANPVVNESGSLILPAGIITVARGTPKKTLA